METRPDHQEAVFLKGMSFRTTVAFVKSKTGEAGVEKTLSLLPPDPRNSLSRTILSTEFYPFEWIVLLQNAALEVIGGDRRTTLKQLGRFSAENALTTVYKIFFKLGSPEFIIRKSAQIYGTYFKGGGMIYMSDETKGFVHLKIDRYAGGHPDFCRRLDGYFEMLLELSGAKNVQVVHSVCAYTGGGKTCEWTAKWT
jgi:hypothetical protein